MKKQTEIISFHEFLSRIQPVSSSSSSFLTDSRDVSSVGGLSELRLTCKSCNERYSDIFGRCLMPRQRPLHVTQSASQIVILTSLVSVCSANTLIKIPKPKGKIKSYEFSARARLSNWKCRGSRTRQPVRNKGRGRRMFEELDGRDLGPLIWKKWVQMRMKFQKKKKEKNDLLM